MVIIVAFFDAMGQANAHTPDARTATALSVIDGDATEVRIARFLPLYQSTIRFLI
jgi:hypothetical protein